LENVKNDYQSQKTKTLEKGDYERFVRSFSPLFCNDEEIKDAAANLDFGAIKTEILIKWNAKHENKPAPLPAKTFYMSQGGVSDISLSDYFEECRAKNLPFIENEKLKDDPKYKAYKAIRNTPRSGIRTALFFPHSIEGITQISEELMDSNDRSIIFMVSNPADDNCELMYRIMGKDSAKRILGVNYVDCMRHTAERRLQTKDAKADGLDVNLRSWMTGRHDEFCEISSTYIMPNEPIKADAGLQNLIKKLTTSEEDERIRKCINAYPFILGDASYRMIGRAVNDLINLYFAEKGVAPSSVHVNLAEYKGFKNFRLNNNLGCFVSVPAKINYCNERYEIKVCLK
jgi:hypothetical protein